MDLPLFSFREKRSNKRSSAIYGFRLEYSIRGISFSLNTKRKYRYFELCVFKNTCHTKKTEKHTKHPVHSLLFLTRLSRDDLLSTESDNIHSLQSLL